ncbi:MAG: hypothetical protein IT294_01235 [Deltaproteobacteria bacterium]|nr:hypothetical protein [Deltaproteobacteria bacterium]
MIRRVPSAGEILKRSLAAIALTLLGALAGCGDSEEAEFESSRCFSDDLGCDATHCATRDTCEETKCKIEEGYDDDLDYFYESKCTDTVTTTTVETPRDGVGIRTTTVRESVTECYYEEEIDDDDFEVTDECEGSTTTTVTREDCRRDPACPTCAPVCSVLDSTVSERPFDPRDGGPSRA